MGRTKPKQQSKSPNKRIEEDDEQDLSMNITPQPATSRKETTENKQSNIPDTKLYRPMTPTKDIYNVNASKQRHIDKVDRARKQQGNNTPTPTIGQDSSPTQEDRKMAAQESDNSKMERMLSQLAENTNIQMKQQEERHAKEIADIKQANRDTHDLFTTKTSTPNTKAVNDHRITAHFNTMKKSSDTPFDGTPENWPIFEHHLLTEAENPTITWNQNITHFQPDN
jgi:hypothetical protein